MGQLQIYIPKIPVPNFSWILCEMVKMQAYNVEGQMESLPQMLDIMCKWQTFVYLFNLILLHISITELGIIARELLKGRNIKS